MSDLSLSRRSMLVGASAAGALGALGAGKWQPALARAPLLGTQAPYFYRFKLGIAEATIVSDGALPLGDPHANFLGLTAEEMDKQLRDNFLPNDNAGSSRTPWCSTPATSSCCSIPVSARSTCSGRPPAS